MFLWLVNFDLWRFDPKLNEFPGLVVDHVFVEFGQIISCCIWDIVRKTETTVTAVGLGKDMKRASTVYDDISHSSKFAAKSN